MKVSYPAVKYDCQDLPEEVLATRSDLQYWLENMLRFHHYTLAEAAQVCGLTEIEVEQKAADLGLYPARPEKQGRGGRFAYCRTRAGTTSAPRFQGRRS